MKRKDYASSYGVIGLGRFGMALVECLSSAGKEVIADIDFFQHVFKAGF